MLPFNFDYYKPEGIQEAIDILQELDQQGKHPMILSGGTELITLGRIDLAYTEAVIDIKGIPEFQVMQMDDNNLTLGSALTLTMVEEANLFPLLTKAAGEVADHTTRGKITLGGNICAQIYYREAVLPFLLSDSQVVIAGPRGNRVEPINEVFQQTLLMEKDEFLVQLITELKAVKAPFFSIKRRQQWKTGYPLLTISALSMNREIRVAISGLCPFPFRSREMEYALNNLELPLEDRISNSLVNLPGPILNDTEGSAAFRIFVLKNLLVDVLSALQ